MRILMLGAGGIGGYYGAKIHLAGGDVSFLVRPARAEQLKKNGLQVLSPFGDMQIAPKIVLAESLKENFDVIVLSCKAYDLDSAMDAIAPAMGVESVILPLLNGVRHIDLLRARFGAERVLGGVANISVTLDAEGVIHHLNQTHRLQLGVLHTPASQWLQPLATLFARTGFEFVPADNVAQALWNKFVFLTALAGATCLMRASVGQILQTVAGEALLNGLFAECTRVAQASGFALSEAQRAVHRSTLNDRASSLKASMLRDVEKGGVTEADHILGDMVARAAAKGVDVPLLRLAYSHLQAYALR